jgi:hypothetical protein
MRRLFRSPKRCATPARGTSPEAKAVNKGAGSLSPASRPD